jgi:hypothetical protein
MRHFQNFAEMFRHVAKLQVSAHLAAAGQRADHRAQSAAVNESHVAQVQNDGAAVAQQPGNVRAQGLALAARNNPPIAAHDGDASDFSSVKRQPQWASNADKIKPAKPLHYIHKNVSIELF